MASILIRPIEETERREAHLAAQRLHGLSLAQYIRRCIRDLRREAREQLPGLFPRASLSSLKPIEKTVYLYLTAVGRRSPPELAAELGLARRRVQEALDGLEAAGLVEALTVSPLPGAPGGRAQRVYASREEK